MAFVKKHHKPFSIKSLEKDRHRQVPNYRLNNELFIVDPDKLTVNTYHKNKQIWIAKSNVDANKLHQEVTQELKYSKQHKMIQAKFQEIWMQEGGGHFKKYGCNIRKYRPTTYGPWTINMNKNVKVHAIKTKRWNLVFSSNGRDNVVQFHIYDVCMDKWIGKFNLGSKYVELMNNFIGLISFGVPIEGNQIVSFAHKNRVCVFNLKDHTWNVVESCELPFWEPNFYFLRGLNLFDNIINISDRNKDFKVICGYAKNTHLHIPQYLLQIVQRYCIFDEIYVYLPSIVKFIDGDYGFNAWRFPVDVLFLHPHK